MKKRRGWFKKARKKFVSKRIFSWDLWSTNYKWTRGYSLQCIMGEHITIRYISPMNEEYQILCAIRKLGPERGFWKAREYAIEHSGNWRFAFNKKIEI